MKRLRLYAILFLVIADPPALAGSPEFPPGDRETIISRHVHKVNETISAVPFPFAA